MKALKILHAADFHLDSPFEALGRDMAAQRRQEQRLLLQRLGDIVRDEGVQAVLLAGDLLDSSRAYLETARSLVDFLAGIKAEVFIAPGNHDYYSDRSPWARIKFSNNVHIFKSNKIECIHIPELGARFWGAAFTEKSAPPLLTGFNAAKLDGLLDVIVMHGEIGASRGSYNTITERELASSGADYAALGHIHSFSGLCRAGSVYYAWPGCPEGRGFDESGEKGVIAGKIGNGAPELRFIPAGGRRYEVLKVDLTGQDDPKEAVLKKLPDKTENDIYKIVLTGECSAGVNLSGLHGALEKRFYHLVLRDRSRAPLNVWERAGEDCLRGLFLSKLRGALESAETENERDTITKAARWGLRALDGMDEDGI